MGVGEPRRDICVLADQTGRVKLVRGDVSANSETCRQSRMTYNPQNEEIPSLAAAVLCPVCTCDSSSFRQCDSRSDSIASQGPCDLVDGQCGLADQVRRSLDR